MIALAWHKVALPPTPILASLGPMSRLTDEEDREIRRELAELRQEHRDLDLAIAAMVEAGTADPIRIQRMKKRKLALKDRIAALEDRRLPDIIA